MADDAAEEDYPHAEAREIDWVRDQQPEMYGEIERSKNA
jgi:hypothetical protein